MSSMDSSGWRPDPWSFDRGGQVHVLRWWDGAAWTTFIRTWDGAAWNEGTRAHPPQVNGPGGSVAVEGSDLPKQPRPPEHASESNSCSSCGRPQQGDWRVCPYCGSQSALAEDRRQDREEPVARSPRPLTPSADYMAARETRSPPVGIPTPDPARNPVLGGADNAPIYWAVGIVIVLIAAIGALAITANTQSGQRQPSQAVQPTQPSSGPSASPTGFQTWAEYLPIAEEAATDIDAVVRDGALAYNAEDYATARTYFAEAARLMAAVPDSPDGAFSTPVHRAGRYYAIAVQQLGGSFPLGAQGPILSADSYIQQAAADLEAARQGS